MTELRLVAEKISLLDQNNGMLRFELFNLKMLSLAFNSICTIQGLDYLKNLKELDLSNNRIKKMDKLNFPCLLNLNLAGNRLKRIENLRNCKKLIYLDLSHNYITDASIKGSS